MKKDNIPDFENKISEQAAALRKSVRYSGAAAAADAKAGAGFGKTSFFSSPGVRLAAAFLTAAIVGGGTYFLCLQLGKSPVSPPPVTVNTEVTDTLPDDTGFVTETDNAVTVPADTSSPDTTEPLTDTDVTDTAEPETEKTDEETTQAETAETTVPETTEPETIVPETTVPETTMPETTVPETTAPHTTADTEKPDPWDGIPPAPEDKNGYKLYVNHIDMTKLAYYGVYVDGSTVLPLSSIVAFLEPGSSEIIDDNTVILKYEDDEFTLKIKERIMTGNHYSGNWFENKQTKTTVLYLADNSILYADGETVNAFLSEFAGGAVRIDKEKKTVTAKDAYYDEDTRHIPVLNESPSKFNKNGYKLYINGNKVDSVSFDVSGDGEATMPFAAVLNCLEHCEVKDFGSAVYVYYGEAVYELQALSYKLTGGNINGNWFTGKNTLFMAFVVKNKTLYTDIGFLNDFLSDFAGGSATIDHDKKIIEIKDLYYKYPINDDPSVTAKYKYSDIFDTDVAHLAPQAGVSSLKNGMKFKDVVAVIGKPHGAAKDNDNYFLWCVQGGSELYLKCVYDCDKEYPSLLHKYCEMYDNGTLETIPGAYDGDFMDYTIHYSYPLDYIVQYGDMEYPDVPKTTQVKIDDNNYLYHLERKSIQKNRSLLERVKVYDNPFSSKKNQTPDTYALNIEVIDVGTALSGKSQNLSINDRKIWICDEYGNKIDYVKTNNYGAATAELFSGTYTLKFEETNEAAALYDIQPFSICYHYNSQALFAVRDDIPKDPSNTEHRLIRIFIYDKREFVPFYVNIIDAETNAQVPGHEMIWEGGSFISDENGQIYIEPIKIFTYLYLFKDNSNPYVPTAYKSTGGHFSFQSIRVSLRKEGYTDQDNVIFNVRNHDALYVSRFLRFRYVLEFVNDDGDPVQNAYVYLNGEITKYSDEKGIIEYDLPCEYAYKNDGEYFDLRYDEKTPEGTWIRAKALYLELPKYSAQIKIKIHKNSYCAQNDPTLILAYDYTFEIVSQTKI